MLARIWSAVLVHTPVRGLSFQVSIQALISALSWRTEVWVPRRSFSVVSSENQRSTRLSQEALVGVKCGTNLGCAVSQRFTAGVLWVETLSTTRCTSVSAGTLASMVLRELRNSWARWRPCSSPMTLPVVTSSAA